ncbi:fibronectin type III domain-containing protein [Streptomyces sp. NPDC004126]|uniref:fibronectin type III domain-containing protein n=1 Tax=Streptomyces sp. NPDC004126 TaxID=3390695 RepID=UPI003CFE28CA
MKRGRAVGAAVLLAPVLFVGMTQPAAARNTHAVTIRGVLNVRDAGGQVNGGSYSETVNLTHDAPRGSFRFERCAGGETRGLLIVTLQLNKDETVTPRGTLYLYEESSCNNNDLDGTMRTAARPLAMDKVRTHHLSVKNDEFLSDDSTSADFSITHEAAGVDVGRPNEPSNVVATAVPVGNEKSVRVDWEDNANNETGYEVRNATLNQNFGVGANVRTFSIPHLDPNLRYCFQVRAVGAQGPSDWTPVGEKVECA